jgi:4-oxalocrotonate tautomerase
MQRKQAAKQVAGRIGQGGKQTVEAQNALGGKWQPPQSNLPQPTKQDHPMPTYHVEMLEGRTLEQKKKLVEEITRVSVEVLGGSPESVDVLIVDVKRENWATGGKLWTEPR